MTINQTGTILKHPAVQRESNDRAVSLIVLGRHFGTVDDFFVDGFVQQAHQFV